MFSQPEFLLFVKLLIANLLTDFVLQKKSWVSDKQKHKIKSKKLYIHVGITAIIAYLIGGEWQIWWLPLYIFVVHLMIDVWKIYQKPKPLYFVIDQFLHVASLLLLVLIWGNKWDMAYEWIKAGLNNTRLLLVIAGYLTVTYPLEIFIGQLTQKRQHQSFMIR